jgi:hypothetical protein
VAHQQKVEAKVEKAKSKMAEVSKELTTSELTLKAVNAKVAAYAQVRAATAAAQEAQEAKAAVMTAKSQAAVIALKVQHNVFSLTTCINVTECMKYRIAF